MDVVKKHLESTIRLLVSHPDNVDIAYTNDEMGTLASIQVDKSDMGKVIGKKGEIINNIRKVIHAIGMSNGVRLSIKVVEP